MWELWRQDSHGNEFLVREFGDRGSAETARDEFTARGHHQHYWVKRPATLRRIHHAAVFTADYARTVAFYREVFGFDAPDEPTQPAVFRLGGVTLHVFEREGISADWSPVRLHHIAFEVGDLAEFVKIRDALLARGACTEDVIDFGEHVSVLATDPDGGMLEVLVANEGALPFPVVPH